MTTVGDLIETTRRHLYGLQQAKYNFLTATITDSASTLTCDLPMGGIVSGALLSCEDEIMFVKSVSGQTATVARGWEDSVAAAHTAAATIEVQPRFPRFAIRQALLDELRSWPRTIFKSTQVNLSGLTTTRAYDITGASASTLYRVTEVRRSPYSGDTTWPIIETAKWEHARNMAVADFPSTHAIFLKGDLASAETLRVTYTGPLTTSTFADATTTDTIGIPDSCLDVPPYGAVWRLLAPREIKRTFTESQGEPRHSDEVPVGSAMRTAAGMKALRDQRIVEEGDRLAATVAIRW